jgi:hypothetical protein
LIFIWDYRWRFYCVLLFASIVRFGRCLVWFRTLHINRCCIRRQLFYNSFIAACIWNCNYVIGWTVRNWLIIILEFWRIRNYWLIMNFLSTIFKVFDVFLFRWDLLRLIERSLISQCIINLLCTSSISDIWSIFIFIICYPSLIIHLICSVSRAQDILFSGIYFLAWIKVKIKNLCAVQN